MEIAPVGVTVHLMTWVPIQMAGPSPVENLMKFQFSGDRLGEAISPTVSLRTAGVLEFSEGLEPDLFKGTSEEETLWVFSSWGLFSSHKISI